MPGQDGKLKWAWIQKDWIGKGGEIAVREVSLGKKTKGLSMELLRLYGSVLCEAFFNFGS